MSFYLGSVKATSVAVAKFDVSFLRSRRYIYEFTVM